MQKKAKEKYLDFQQKKLTKKSELIEERHKRKIEKFNDEIKDELEKIKEFNQESEILKNLDMKKIKKIRKFIE